MNPADVAELFEDLPREKMALVFRLLPKELAAESFSYMDPDEQSVLVEAFSEKELHDVVNELYVDDMVDIIEEMPANLVKRILRHTDAETRRSINPVSYTHLDVYKRQTTRRSARTCAKNTARSRT